MQTREQTIGLLDGVACDFIILEPTAGEWLVDPLARTLEAFVLTSTAEWLLLGTWRDNATVLAAPFAAVELELAALWAK